GGALAGHPEVDGCTDRAYVAHELLGGATERRLYRSDGEQRVVRAGLLCRGHCRHVRESTDPRRQGLHPWRAGGCADDDLDRRGSVRRKVARECVVDLAGARAWWRGGRGGGGEFDGRGRGAGGDEGRRT